MIFFCFFFCIFFAKKFQSHMGILGLFFFWKKHENEKIDFCQVLVWVCIKYWDIMKLASTWRVLDPERVCSELNELFFLNFTWKVHFMVQLLSQFHYNYNLLTFTYYTYITTPTKTITTTTITIYYMRSHLLVTPSDRKKMSPIAPITVERPLHSRTASKFTYKFYCI